VTEGKVSVSEVERVVPNALSPAARIDDNALGQPVPPPDTFLVANERVLVPTPRPATAMPSAPKPLPRVEQLAPAVIRDALSWQGPRLVFVDTPLAEVVAQFNRRNSVQLVLADNDLATLPVGGSFRPEDVEAFVRLLESGGDVVVDRTDESLLVLRRAK